MKFNSSLSFISSSIYIIAILALVTYITVIYLDLRRRKYEVYADSIWYSE
jgi:uncharacterized protein involved in exopolysaccharide biosynthesis